MLWESVSVGYTFRIVRCGGCTFCPLVLHALHIVHLLERFRLLLGECLLVIVLARPAQAVEEYATTLCVLEEPYYAKDEGDDGGGAKGGEQAD
jgi:hypothetical protein